MDKKAILFCRVSTDQQSNARQVSDLTALAKEDGYLDSEIDIIEYKESAVKNSIQDRVSIQEMKAVIEQNPIEVVYVTEVSRLARRGDVMYAVLALLEEKHICLTIKEPSVLRTIENGERNPMAHMVIAYMTQNAQTEVELRHKRQMSGISQKIKEGKLTNTCLFGYQRNKEGYPVPHPEEAPIVVGIFNMYVNGESVGSIYEKYNYHKGIKKNLKKTGVSFISRILRTKAYIGEHAIFKYPAIIDKETFLKAAERAKERQFKKTCLQNVYLCQGLVKYKGHTMTVQKSKACYHYAPFEGHVEASLNINCIDGIVFHKACAALGIMMEKDNHEALENAKKGLRQAELKLQSLEDDKANNKQQAERLNSLYIKGRIGEDAYDFETGRLDKEMSHILNEIDEQNITIQKLSAVINNEGSKMQANLTYNQLTDITDDRKKQEIVRQAVKEVVVKKIDTHHFEFRIVYNEPSLNFDDEYYDYKRRGKVILLLHYKGDFYENLSGTWEVKFKSWDGHKRKQS